MRHPKSQWFLKLGIPFSWVILEAVDRWGSLLFWIIPHLWASRWSPNFRWFPNIKSHYISLHFRYISEPQVVLYTAEVNSFSGLVKDPTAAMFASQRIKSMGAHHSLKMSEKLREQLQIWCLFIRFFLVSEPFWRVYPSHFQTDPIDHSSKSHRLKSVGILPTQYTEDYHHPWTVNCNQPVQRDDKGFSALLYHHS